MALLLAVIAISIVTCRSWHRTTEDLIVGYLPTWQYECYQDIDFDMLTDICIAFVNPDSAGNLSCAIPDDALDKIVKKAHKNGVKVLIAMGGGNGYANYTALTSDGKSIKAFDKKIADWLDEHDLDGVDINIEGDVEPEFWDNYDAWIRDLKKRCGKGDRIVSCAVATWFDRNISDKTLDRFDHISVMAYDNKSDSENPATLGYAEENMKYFSEERDVSPEKLLLGIPFYGYRYRNGVCTGEVVTYYEIATYNKGSENADASGTCRYNGIDTVKAKTKLGCEYGGVMVWALGQDASGRKSLLRAINEAM